MQIRRLLHDDAPRYRELRLRALREHPDAFTSDADEEALKPLDWYAQRLGAPGQAFWGAWEEGALCGALGLEHDFRAKTRHRGKVVGMYVAPECSGRGGGRALLDALLAHARTVPLELLVLTVTEGNRRAQALYERAGFRSFGIEPRAIRVGGRDLAKNHMYLEVAAP
jgi:ribosomal protein S18 acetylase RimI-like enzyme